MDTTHPVLNKPSEANDSTIINAGPTTERPAPNTTAAETVPSDQLEEWFVLQEAQLTQTALDGVLAVFGLQVCL